MSLINLITLEPLGDDRGSLVALESNKSVPFDIKRVYYIFDTRLGIARGFHAHKSLNQLAVCVTGRCRMLLDNGREKEEVLLDSPTQGLLIEKLVWHEMREFSPGCILLVFASEHYDESDYIRDYEIFLRAISDE
jgi:dTDP-4-dehydrorhamnose 3,5-epimerase-like enzyme